MSAADKIKIKQEADKLFQKKKYDKAIKCYRDLVKLNRRDDRSMMRIAECFKKLGKDADAIAAFRQVAEFYANSGFDLKALAVNKQILAIDPKNVDAEHAIRAINERRGISTQEVPAPRLEPAQEAEVEEETLSAADAAEVTEDLEDAGTDVTELEVVEPLELTTTPPSAPAAQPAAPASPLAGRTLPSIPLFSDLNADELAFAISTCHFRQVPAKTRIIEEGEMGNSMFILVSGEVLVYRHDESGRTIKITTLKEGSFFGEFALLSDSKRHASVGAMTSCELLEITRDHLEKITAKYPRVQEVMNEFYKKRILATLLLTSPLFQPLSIEDRKNLVTRFAMVKAPSGKNILQEGGPGDGLYLIKSGEVEVLIHDKDGQEITITYLSEGSFFGEISLIRQVPCTATVRTTQETILLKLPKDAFQEVILTHPQVLELIGEYVEERQKETSETRQSINAISQVGLV